MIFNYRDADLDICFNNVRIQPVTSTKFLGITLASDPGNPIYAISSKN